MARLDEWQDLITSTANIPDKDQAVALHERIRRQAVELEQTAEKFRRQLHGLIEGAGGAPRCLPILQERCEKAIEYFTERIATALAAPLRVHSDSFRGKKKLKRYLAHVSLFERICWEKIESLYDAKLLDRSLYAGARRYRRDEREDGAETSPATSGNQAGHKEKGATLTETLDLQRGGRSPEEIAAMRGLTVGTIKSHLARLIERGELDAHDVLPTTTIDAVIAFLRDHVDANLTAIRTGTGDRFDYNDIRMAVAHWARTHASKQA